MLYPSDIESKIDFGIIRDALRRLCTFELGKVEVDNLHFIADETILRKLLTQTQEMVNVLSDATYQYPEGAKTDLRESLSRIRVEGLFLDENEVDSLRKTIATMLEVTTFLRNLDEERFPLLYALAQETAISGLVPVAKEIERILDKYGKIKDSASPELARIRHDLLLAQGSVSRALTTILSKAKSEGIIDGDVTPTLREGRLVIPVSPAYKRKLGGIVHDESATGKTVYVEPQQVVEANNHIRELEGDERRERIKILLAFTAFLRPYVQEIVNALYLLGKVDFIHAKALFAKDLNAIFPELKNKPFVDLKEARHPVLTLNFRKQNREVVPLNIRLSKDTRILVISGPNAGGKSVCLKTVALLQYMLQCGLLIPVREDTRCGIFKNIFIDIGDSQSIEDDLSTYSSHLRNMKHFLRHAERNTLFLIDEFGSGTEPMMGGAIAESILVELNKQLATGVVTTHYTNLKHLAEDTDGIGNAAMLYDRGQLRPLFQLSIGQAGSSFAIEIAKQIGLPDEIITTAKDLVGEDKIDYDKHLQDIARDKRYWENKRQAVKLKEKHLEEQIAKYDEQMADIKAKRKEILLKAKEEASQLLEESNATIENTIRIIKEAKADKEKTKKARETVEKMKAKVQPAKSTKKPEEPLKGKVLHDFRDLKPLSKNPAVIISEAPVGSAQKRSSVADEIRKKKLAFSNDLDLRGYRADEALAVLMNYVDDAIMVGTSQIRILHGTGTGALKKVIREYLKSLKEARAKGSYSPISDFHDGDPDKGGAGITIVEF